jgi:hypothetical protein
VSALNLIPSPLNKEIIDFLDHRISDSRLLQFNLSVFESTSSVLPVLLREQELYRKLGPLTQGKK